MPELPEIEAEARALRERIPGRQIAAVDLPDPTVLRGSGRDDLEAALAGWHVRALRRHGKVLFLELDSGWKLAVHYGMTGRLLARDSADREPERVRAQLRFSDGGALAFDDRRRLGWIELTDDIPHYLHSQDIGPDALALDGEDLAARLSAKRGQLKSVLTDQAVVAGLGNVWADEVLFQAGLRPDRRSDRLSQAEVEALQRKMQRVLESAAQAGADVSTLPDGWLTPQRGQSDARCPTCGGALESAKLGGRTAWLCPHCQV
jgi:formamidopyrimidine-DNA glycosylase